MEFNPAEMARLRALLDEGGLQSTGDVIRLQVRPAPAVPEERWRKFLIDNPGLIAKAAQSICDAKDFVDFRDGLLTVFLHPDNRDRAMHVRLSLLTRIADALNGVSDVKIALAADPGSEGMPGSPPQEVIHTFESIEFDLKSLPVPPSKSLVFQSGRTSAGLPLVFVRVIDASRADRKDDYYEAGERLAQIDIEALRAASQIAFKCLKLKIGEDHLRVIFPINVNNLRRIDTRDALLFELRQIPELVLARMQPALVRIGPDLSEAMLSEALSNLTKRFDTIWQFVEKAADPRKVDWSRKGFGMLVDTAPEANALEWRRAWIEAAVSHDSVVAFLNAGTVLQG